MNCTVCDGETRLPAHVCLVFLATLLSATVFPLIPLWGFGIRLAALLLVWYHRRSLHAELGKFATWYFVALVALAAHLCYRLAAILTSRLNWIIDRVAHIHGLEMAATDAFLLWLLDGALIGGLVWLAWRQLARDGGGGKWRLAALGAAVAFIAWGAASTLWHALDTPPDATARNLLWLRLWMEWVMCFLVALSVFRRDHRNILLKMIVVAGAFHAALILAQHLVRDYSYVLESPASFGAYFLRVRGNYYYHGAASQFLLLPLFAVLMLDAAVWKRRWLWTAGPLIVLALYVNGTRAVSLAACVGFGLFLLLQFPWRRGRFAATAFSALSLLLFTSTIFYIKPSGQDRKPSGQDRRPPSAEPIATGPGVAAPGAKSAVCSYAETSSSRTRLVRSGLGCVMASPLWGQGPGNIEVPLDVPLGGFSTYSSHFLFLDTFLAAGFVAGVALLGWWAIPPCRLVCQRLFDHPSPGQKQWVAGAAGLCAAFGVSGVFFGIERSDTVTLFAALVGVLLAESAKVTAASPCRPALPRSSRFPGRAVTAGAACAALLAAVLSLRAAPPLQIVLALSAAWAVPILLACSERPLTAIASPRMMAVLTLLVLTAGAVGAAATSSCYVWPAVEFAWRDKHDPLWSRASGNAVYTNSPALARTTRLAYWLLGDKETPVRLLEDNPARIPSTGKTLWNPANDRHYPNLIRWLGYLESRPYHRAPAFRLPKEWSVIRSKQMTVSFINIGPRVSPPLCPTDFGRVVINGRRVDWLHQEHSLAPAEKVCLQFLPDVPMRLVNGKLQCSFATDHRTSAEELGEFVLQGEVTAASGRRIPVAMSGHLKLGANRALVALPSDDISRVELTLESDSQVAFVSFHAELLCTLMPELASSADDIRDANGARVRAVADDNHATAWSFRNDDPKWLALDFGASEPRIGLYRLSSFSLPQYNRTRLSWELEGSRDGENWKVVDARREITLPCQYESFRSFLVARPGKYRFYRLNFSVDSTDEIGKVGLAEIELFGLDPSEPGCGPCAGRLTRRNPTESSGSR